MHCLSESYSKREILSYENVMIEGLNRLIFYIYAAGLVTAAGALMIP